MQVTLQEMADQLRQNSAYKIFYHKKPDGDAIGSAHALALGLRSLGIRCALYCHDPVPDRYRYLTDRVPQDPLPRDCPAIAVDSAGPKRLGKYEGEVIHFCIDHHENNGFTAALQYVEAQASSCAELILKLLQALQIPLTGLIADFLYTGLVTDTLCFRTRSTNAQTMAAAAQLAASGADIVDVARRQCLMKSPQRMAIESVLCSSFHYTCDGRVLGCLFTNEEMVSIGIRDAELEGLNAVVEQVEGIDIGIVIREIQPGFCRVSVRAINEAYDAAKICAHFGGGGHTNAAGCEIAGKPQEALARVEAVCETVIRG